jgi:hypothetical protein
MNALKIIGSILLVVAAMWVCARYHRLFLIERGPVGVMRFLAGLLCVMLLGLGSWAGFYAMSISPEWARLHLYGFLPITVGTCYVYEVYTFKNLQRQWKRSPLFIMALLVPVLGCVLMLLIWGHDDGRRRYLQQKSQLAAGGKV